MPAARALLTLLALSTISFTTACGAPGEPFDEADSASDDDVEPRNGTWSYVGSEAVDDTCMFDQLTVDSPGTFKLTNNGDGTFTVDDSQNVFDCTIDGPSFSCPSRLHGEHDIGAAFSLEAIVSYNISATGSFSSATAMSGRQQIVVTCAGADCATFEVATGVTTPCGWAQDFTASRN